MLIHLIVSGVLFLGSLIAFLVMNQGNVDARNRKALLFLLVFGVLITVPAFCALLPSVTDSLWWFIGLQALYLVLGIVFHNLLQKEVFGQFRNLRWSAIALTVANAALGYTGFTLLFDFLNPVEVGHLFGMSILLFLIPRLFMISFELLASIPPEIHKVWYYPVNEDEPDFDNIDLNKIFFIELEFSKRPTDVEVGNYKAKAPVDMMFSEWFRSFINNYNYKFEEDPIQYLNENNEPHGWMFFTKSSFWRPQRYVDPDLSIKNNRLNEKTVIVAKRVEIDHY